MARRWATTDRAVAGSLQRLNSGQRIATAADDAAGLAIAERLRAQSTGTVRAQRNVMDGISMAQSADAVLGEIHSMLQRARELAVAYHHGTMSSTDKAALQSEADALDAEATRLVAGAGFNGVSFLAGGNLTVHIGAGDPDAVSTGLPDVMELLNQDAFSISGEGATIVVTAPGGAGGGSGNGNGNGNGGGNGNGNAGGNGNGNANGHVNSDPSGSGSTTTSAATTTTTTTAGTSKPIDRIDQAINAVSMYRGLFGAFQNRLEHALANLATSHESLLAAESRIRDADMAVEVTTLTRNRIRAQATAALAAQGHLRAHDVVKLLEPPPMFAAKLDRAA